MRKSRQQPSEVVKVLVSTVIMVLVVSSQKGLENQRGSYLREFESPSPGHLKKLLQTPKTPHLATLSALSLTQKQNKNLTQHRLSSHSFSLEYGKYTAKNSRIIAESFSVDGGAFFMSLSITTHQLMHKLLHSAKHNHLTYQKQLKNNKHVLFDNFTKTSFIVNESVKNLFTMELS